MDVVAGVADDVGSLGLETRNLQQLVEEPLVPVHIHGKRVSRDRLEVCEEDLLLNQLGHSEVTDRAEQEVRNKLASISGRGIWRGGGGGESKC